MRPYRPASAASPRSSVPPQHDFSDMQGGGGLPSHKGVMRARKCATSSPSPASGAATDITAVSLPFSVTPLPSFTGPPGRTIGARRSPNVDAGSPWHPPSLPRLHHPRWRKATITCARAVASLHFCRDLSHLFPLSRYRNGHRLDTSGRMRVKLGCRRGFLMTADAMSVLWETTATKSRSNLTRGRGL